MPAKVAIAIGAHPDDIEFYMAGTLLLVKRAGYDIHYFNVANGCCGSVQYNARQLARIQGMKLLESLFDQIRLDLGITT